MLAKGSSSMNDIPFGLAFIHYSNLGMIMFVPLAKLFPIISRPCTGLLCWFGSSMGLCFTQSLFIHGLDEYSLDYISSYALDGFTLGFLFIYLSFQGKLMNDTSLRPRILFIHACLPLVDHSGWMYKNEGFSYNYVYTWKYIIYISENPNLCKHSSTGMAHAQELVPLGNKKHTNSSMNSIKVKTLMYFLGDY